MRIEDVRRRLVDLPDPLPPVPQAVGPVIVGQPGSLPGWVTRAQDTPPRRAAALVLLYPGADDEAMLVLTERPSGDLRHPGQISLPGGAEDPTDDFPVGTALREAAEEIGLHPLASGVATMGVLETVDVRVSGFLLVPVLAIADRAPELTRHEREVAAILHVPASVFAAGAAIEVVDEERDGYRMRYGAYLFEGHRIWGATARVLGQLGAVLVDPTRDHPASLT